MDRKLGCVVALVGCAVAALSVLAGLSGTVGAMQDVNLGDAYGSLGFAVVGGTTGLIVFIVGIGKAISGGSEPEEGLCPKCGCHLWPDAKTCMVCGKDVN